MNLLLIDAGNARLKWALRGPDGIGPADACEYGADSKTLVEKLRDNLSGPVDAIAVCNVAGQRVEELLGRALSESQRGLLWFARSTRYADGVRNAYTQAEQLGVDRWAAIVGAHARMRARGETAPLCVVDAGTALTIDALERDGTHLGGLILPGIALQRATLLERTADIEAHTRESAKAVPGLGVFATDTATAIAQSGAFACAAAIDACVGKMAAQSSQRPVVLLTGGDAAELAPWLATGFEICPNLVLEGLAILFEQRSSD